MTSNYVLKSTGLPRYVDAQVKAVLKGYNAMRDEYDNMLQESPDPPDGQPRGSGSTDPTSRAAARRADIKQKLEAVEQSILSIPEEYRQGVWDNAVYGASYPANADRTTYWRYKAKFFRRIAKRMCWI